MLETIREYATERLQESGELHDVQARHADFFVGFAREAEEGWFGPAQQEWLDRVAAEQGNLRVALAWLESSGRSEDVLAIVGGVRYFWANRGVWSEGLRWVEPALEQTQDLERGREQRPWGRPGRSPTRSATTRRRERMPRRASRSSATSAIRRRSVVRWAGSPRSWPRWATSRRHEPPSKKPAHYLRVGRRSASLGLVLGNLADLATRVGDFERADSLLQEALELYRSLGWKHGANNALHNLAFLRFRRGVEAEAMTLARRACC